MFNEACEAHDVPPSVYINLVAAHELVVRMRDNVRFVSSLVDAIGEPLEEITIRQEVLAACMSCLVDELEEVAEAVRWSKEACVG
ncbi:hypothetical protein LYSHEL_27260 [Lysobacter helvus]|uniref:Uncharacterized protein n=2 Tax=Lysobacteraceae TaxID=32033 RepID=A0ABN6FW78_9GAMM|nr:MULTISPECIES: hypothetical protein [Lysobacter]BCT93699.1 hypothetical protein LYSCAS_27230 [Lysobacter caseinilyticus]BCT96855.1 hypothetical protein LYSHEL_27260 [Lysobacter helvus]